MRVARTRIRVVRLKNGAELRLLPSAQQRTTADVWENFERALEYVRQNYGDNFGGFVLIPWTIDGAFNTHICVQGLSPQPNGLPTWVAEAVRRHFAESDARRFLGLAE